jgi:hypothetical protein
VTRRILVNTAATCPGHLGLLQRVRLRTCRSVFLCHRPCWHCLLRPLPPLHSLPRLHTVSKVSALVCLLGKGTTCSTLYPMCAAFSAAAFSLAVLRASACRPPPGIFCPAALKCLLPRCLSSCPRTPLASSGAGPPELVLPASSAAILSATHSHKSVP